jgi:hypothetical protein
LWRICVDPRPPAAALVNVVPLRSDLFDRSRFAKNPLEDRIDMFGVVAEIEQIGELGH